MGLISIRHASKLGGISYQCLSAHIRHKRLLGRSFKRIPDNVGPYWVNEELFLEDLKIYKRGQRKSAEKKIGFRVTAWERETIEALAEGAGLTVAEWCRSCSILGAKNKSI